MDTAAASGTDGAGNDAAGDTDGTDTAAADGTDEAGTDTAGDADGRDTAAAGVIPGLASAPKSIPSRARTREIVFMRMNIVLSPF
jgi:hypothetical protein